MDYFEDGGKHYLVMDYIEGQTLDELLEGRSEPFPEAQITDWAHQLCGVLEYLHNQPQPIIFRDLKPGNIMVDNNDQVQLIDFGIARLFKPGKNRDTASFGTTGYAPPEQYGRGQTDPRSDIYALGATLHHLVTLRDPGDEPFKFPAPNTINPALSSELNDAITKAVAQEPDRRWSSAANFARALDTAQAVSVQPVIQTQVSAAVVTQPVSHKVHPAPEPEVTPKSERQKRLPQRGILIAGGIILALLITFGALYLLDVLPASSTTGAAFPGIRSFEYTYTSNRDGKREVYRLDENGEVVRITNSPGSAESWSPTTSSGGSLLFTSTRAGKREVFRLDKSGDTARVTNTPGGAESWSPSISARGRTLFTSNRDGKREIYRIDENGEVARVTHTPADAESWSPTLSPSGNLLFTSNRDGKRDIYRIDENGEVARVTHTPGDGESWSATLSPQGKILFTSNRDGKREIYRMDEDGDIARVTHTPADAESWAPIRTPAGSILFTSNRGGKAEIYRLEPSGDVVRVTNTPAHAESWTGQDE
jgi:serine/threonine protein kinase